MDNMTTRVKFNTEVMYVLILLIYNTFIIIQHYVFFSEMGQWQYFSSSLLRPLLGNTDKQSP